MKSKEGSIYTVVVTGEKKDLGDLKDCLVVSCTNKRSLSEISGVDYDRLVYVFTRKGLNILYSEKEGCIIFRSSNLYKGRQRGGIRNKKLLGFNRQT
jgi:hypothetical protein